MIKTLKRIRYWKVLLISLGCTVSVALIGWVLFASGPKNTSEAFIMAMLDGNIEKAKELASGNVLVNLSRDGIAFKGPLKLVNLELECNNLSKDWGIVRAIVETETDDGEIDVHWYTLRLYKGNTWQVYYIEPIHEYPKGLKARITNHDKNETLKCLESYLKKLIGNEYEPAAGLLVGPAKRSHLASMQVLGKYPVLKKFEKVTYYPLWKQGKFLFAKADYLADSREVKIGVLFYNTSKGWRIVEITPM